MCLVHTTFDSAIAHIVFHSHGKLPVLLLMFCVLWTKWYLFLCCAFISGAVLHKSHPAFRGA